MQHPQTDVVSLPSPLSFSNSLFGHSATLVQQDSNSATNSFSIYVYGGNYIIGAKVFTNNEIFKLSSADFQTWQKNQVKDADTKQDVHLPAAAFHSAVQYKKTIIFFGGTENGYSNLTILFDTGTRFFTFKKQVIFF